MAQVIEVHPEHPQFNYVVYMGAQDEMERFITEMVKRYEALNEIESSELHRQITVVRPDFIILELQMEGEAIQSRIVHYQIV